MTSARGIRAANRASIETALLDVARRHLADHGAAGLSLRAVARDLGMAPSAVFRYVANRDDLLTRLIVAGYTDLADAVAEASASVPRSDFRTRWRTLAHAVRDWARRHPHDYALLFGTPVPRYHAPAEQTTPAGTRVTTMLADIGREAAAAGVSVRPVLEEVAGSADLAERATRSMRADGELAEQPLDPVWLANGVTAWTLLIGAVTSELFEQLGPDRGDSDALFGYLVAVGEVLLFGVVQPAETSCG